MDLCTFSVAGSYYGIPVFAVEEIFRPVPVTAVPGADPRVAGIINLRGSSAACIDLRKCLNVEPSASEGPSIKDRMILLEANSGLIEDAQTAGVTAFEEPIVVLADCVHAIDRVDPEQAHPPPAHMTNGFVVSVYEQSYGYLSQLDVVAIVNDILSQEKSHDS